jgi:hypothetical protein
MEMISALPLIIGYLIHQLLRDMAPKSAGDRRHRLIVFVFRAMPGSGAGAGWWQIDVLDFDEAFFGTLRQMSSILAILGMFALRGWMSRRPIPYLVVFLSLYSTLMTAPFIGMYYGLHEWTEQVFGFGARTIALIDTMADSPLGQVAMVPMLAWIAREAPENQKATYFAVMAAFTNLALSAASPRQLPEPTPLRRRLRRAGPVDDRRASSACRPRAAVRSSTAGAAARAEPLLELKGTDHELGIIGCLSGVPTLRLTAGEETASREDRLPWCACRMSGG